MQFDDNEEDCTIYIEELKSDDSNLKINAVNKINSIAQILGPTRVREELLPYIIDIIEELDNEDEFLIKLTSQLLNLKDFIGGKEHAPLLIAPLEILSSMEESSVREKAVEALIKIADGQTDNFFIQHFLPVIKQLAGWDNYPSRMSACSLIGACFKYYKDQESQEVRQIFKELCKDDTPMVRRTAAHNLILICSDIEQEAVKEELLPLWQKFILDDIDSVKVKAIESSIKFIKYINNKESQEIIMQQIKDVISLKKNSWRIRYAVAEILGQLSEDLDKEVVRNQVVQLFEDLLKDSEQEVRSISLLKLAEVCKHLTENQLAINILSKLNGMINDTSQHVRISLAEILCKISLYFQPKSIVSGIIPIIESLLKDEMLDVRLAIIKNINHLNAVIGADNIKQHVLPLFNNIANEKQWRFRLAFCEFMPKLCEQIGFDQFKDNFQKFINSQFMDHYAAIREQNFNNLFDLCNNLGYGKLKLIVESGLSELSKNTNYIFRITAIQGLVRLKEVIPKNELNDLFNKITDGIIDEKVPNVKINMCKCFLQLDNKLDQQVKNKFLSKAAKLKQDPDFDVSYFANQIN